jgi:hypothetical protein
VGRRAKVKEAGANKLEIVLVHLALEFLLGHTVAQDAGGMVAAHDVPILYFL